MGANQWNVSTPAMDKHIYEINFISLFTDLQGWYEKTMLHN